MLLCNSKVSGILFDPARDPASSKLGARGEPRNGPERTTSEQGGRTNGEEMSTRTDKGVFAKSQPDLERLMIGRQQADAVTTTTLVEVLSPQLHRFFAAHMEAAQRPMTCCGKCGYTFIRRGILIAPVSRRWPGYTRSPAAFASTIIANGAVSNGAKWQRTCCLSSPQRRSTWKGRSH